MKVFIEAPEDSEDCVVGGEGNGDAETGSHEEEQEESGSSAKPVIFLLATGLNSFTSILGSWSWCTGFTSFKRFRTCQQCFQI